MLDILPFDVLVSIFKFLNYYDIINILHTNKKLKNSKEYKRNLIWKRFFTDTFLQYTSNKPDEYFYYSTISRILNINSYYICFSCQKQLTTKYYLILCDNCDKSIKLDTYRNLKYHMNCLNLKKCTYSKVNYTNCPLCNYNSIYLECNIYS
jgi:hypothetical protein